MIKIDKPAQAPEILSRQGKRRRRTYCANFDKHEAEYRACRRTFPFDPQIYAHETVKAALVLAHHGKCCFCEIKIGTEGDVEHFRPKAGCQSSASGPLLRPGYYWLAYEWDNLLLACKSCNQLWKKNLFPLLNENDRARCHKDDLLLEDPLLINPAETDPQDFISFREEIAFPVDGNVKGKITIAVLGLNRPNLWEKRRDRLAQTARVHNLVDLLQKKATLDSQEREILKDAKAFLAQTTKGEAEFAGMARAAKASEPGL